MERGEVIGRAVEAPARSELVEHLPQRTPEQSPQERPANDEVRGQAREKFSVFHDVRRWIRASQPAPSAKMSEAPPRLLATELFLVMRPRRE